MCFSPLIAQRSSGGGRPRFSQFTAGDPFLALPCGKCLGCRRSRAQAWAARALAESQMHPPGTCWFVTATYAPEFNPVSLVLRDHTLFAKRVRNEFGPFRFLMSGEYGEQADPVTGFGRPHFHYLFFGLTVPDIVQHHRTKRGPIYSSPRLSDAWGKGHVYIGTVEPESALYVAGYIDKKVLGDRAEAHYSVTHPRTGEPFKMLPEFSLMSRRPGLGASWFAKYGRSDVIPQDRFPLKGGKYVKTPKYFDTLYSRMREADPGLPPLEDVKAKRIARAQFQAEDFTDARLKVRERCAAARAKFFSRKTL